MANGFLISILLIMLGVVGLISGASLKKRWLLWNGVLALLLGIMSLFLLDIFVRFG